MYKIFLLILISVFLFSCNQEERTEVISSDVVFNPNTAQENKEDIPVYSDSRIAMSWIRKKQCRTNLVFDPSNKELLELIKRAEKWLKENTFKNPILKWETKAWGEIPADFGRK